MRGVVLLYEQSCRKGTSGHCCIGELLQRIACLMEFEVDISCLISMSLPDSRPQGLYATAKGAQELTIVRACSHLSLETVKHCKSL